MNKKLVFAALAASMAFGTTAMAQIYVTGEVTTPNWNPGTGVPVGGGTAADMVLHDDGLNGDTTAADGIFTCRLTFAQAGLTPGQRYEWKAASSGFGPPNTPDQNGQLIAPASGDVIFYLDTNVRTDGFLPNAGSSPTTNGIVYTNLARGFVDGATSTQVAGSFQSERGGTDFTPGDPASAIALTDAGNGTSGDGIYQGTVTGIPSGTYTFKITHNGAYSSLPAAPASAEFGTVGLGGNDYSFSSLDSSNVITFTLNANTSRVKVTNPSATAGPPFYAQSTAWSTAYSAAEQLNFNVGSNTYSKTFNVAAAGTYSVRVRQGAGRSYPDSGDYPFTTTAPNTVVRVVFDRNTYADGSLPASDFIVVLKDSDGSSLNAWSKVQPVGNWQVDFGAAGNYDAGVAAMDANDGGTSGDITAGDGIYSISLTPFATATGKEVKAVGQRLGGTDTGFTIQFGGTVDGITLSGNNAVNTAFGYTTSTPVLFQIDTITGRVKTSGTAGATKPTRGAYVLAGPGSPVSDWSVF